MPDIDEEFDSLELPDDQVPLAWEARAKVTWGERADDVQTWLMDHAVDAWTAERIVTIVVRERASAIRTKGVRDLVLGILAMVIGAALGGGTIVVAKLGLVAVPIKGFAFIVALGFLVFMYGVHLTWRGLVRVIGGARVTGAVSDVDD